MLTCTTLYDYIFRYLRFEIWLSPRPYHLFWQVKRCCLILNCSFMTCRRYRPVMSHEIRGVRVVPIGSMGPVFFVTDPWMAGCFLMVFIVDPHGGVFIKSFPQCNALKIGKYTYSLIVPWIHPMDGVVCISIHFSRFDIPQRIIEPSKLAIWGSYPCYTGSNPSIGVSKILRVLYFDELRAPKKKVCDLLALTLDAWEILGFGGWGVPEPQKCVIVVTGILGWGG